MANIKIAATTQEKPACCIGIWHLLAGILMVILGAYVWLNPIVSLVALSLYIGAALIVIGAGYVGSSMDLDSGWFMFVGVIDIIVGIILVANIGVTAVTLPVIFAIWCIAVGVAQLVSSYHQGKSGLHWGWSFILGALGIVFGFLILKYPGIGAITISTLLGLYIILYGLLEISEYFYFRRVLPQINKTSE